MTELLFRAIYSKPTPSLEFGDFYKSKNLIVGLEEKENIEALMQIDNLRNDTYNIVIVGDSVAFGLGVDKSERFSNVLERMIRENHTDFDFLIINIATTSHSTIQELEYFKEYFSNKKVDLVILVIIGYVFNDPGEATSSSGIERLEALHSVKELRKREKAILDKINASNFCKLRNIFRRSVLLEKTGLMNLLFFKGAPIFGSFYDYMDSKKHFIVKQEDGCFWQEITYSFSEFERLSKRNDFDVLVVIFPILFNDYSWNDYPLIEIYEKVNGEALKNNFFTIDMLDTFNNYPVSKIKRKDLMDTIHPNAFGHELVAKEILKFLKEREFKK
ncbi:MAG: hypothetical protein KJ583_01820 [Nanoarchaeota archaeon]|nr:hypothetical protein [Nanoarchaeota archaeon]